MNNFFRKISVVVLLGIFTLGMGGCLDSAKKTAAVVNKPVVPTTPTTPTVTTPTTPTTPVATGPVYNPNGNKKPIVTYFNTNDLTDPIVEKGQKVTFSAKAMDPEGKAVQVKFEASGGVIDAKGVWTAPDQAGFYQISATAADPEGTVSEPYVYTIKVKKSAGEAGIDLSDIKVATDKPLNGPKRALAMTSGTPNTYVLYTASPSNTATITLVFTDTLNKHSISTNYSAGSLQATGETQAAGVYTATYTYTAPTTNTSTGKTSVKFTVFNTDVPANTMTATITFLLDTRPAITNIAWSPQDSSTVIGLGTTRTIAATATDADLTLFDSLTFQYSLLSGGGTLSESSNKLGTVDYKAPSAAGTALLLIQAIDTRGGSVTKTFTINIQDPTTLVVADNGVAGATEKAKLDEAVAFANKYDIKNKTIGVNLFASLPILQGGDIVTQLGNYPYYYFYGTQLARTAHSVLWEVFNEKSLKIKGPNGLFLTSDGQFTPAATFGLDDENGYKFFANAGTPNGVLRGGAKKIKATLTAGTETNFAEGTVYVNQSPSITTISYTDAQGNAATLFGASGMATPIQVSAGQMFNVNVSFADADNERVALDTTTYPVTTGYGFTPNASPANVFATWGSKPGITIKTQDTAGSAAGTQPTSLLRVKGLADQADINVPTDTTQTSKYTFPNTYTTALTNIPITIATAPVIDTANTYHYMWFHANDGGDRIVDVGADGLADYFKVGYEIVPVTATEYDAGANPRMLDIGTVASMTSYSKKLRLDFLDATASNNPANPATRFKIYNVETSSYMKLATGTDVDVTLTAVGGAKTGNLVADGANTIDPNNGDLAANAYPAGGIYDLSGAAVQDATVDWLAIDTAVGVGSAWKNGDKVYFDTAANTVKIKCQVINGPKITAINAQRYVTLKDTAKITVVGSLGASSSGSTILVTETSNSGGLLEKGTDSDGDLIIDEVWNYTAPSSMPATRLVSFTVKITDNAGNINSKTLSMVLNTKPVIDSITPSGTVDTTDGNWILKSGAGNPQGGSIIDLTASATDADLTDMGTSGNLFFGQDSLQYNWNLGSPLYGSLLYPNSMISQWIPINAGVPLGATSGPYQNGHIPVQVTVLDRDPNGIYKGGVAQYTMDIGINEPPKLDATNATPVTPVRNLTAADLGTLAEVAVAAGSKGALTTDDDANFNNSSEYANAEFLFSLNSDAVKQTVPTDLRDPNVEDENVLNFDWYVTLDAPDGPTAMTPIGELYTESEIVDTIPAQRLHWVPNKTARSITRDYYIHTRVSDQKNGVAKGITDQYVRVQVTADTTAPIVAAGDLTATALIDNGTAGVYGIGDKVRFKIQLNATALLHDLVSATIDLSTMDGGPTIPMVYADNDTPDVYSDDYLYYDYEIKGGATGTVDLAAGGAANPGVTVKDIAGNVAAPVLTALAAGLGVDDIIDGTLAAPPTLVKAATNPSGLAGLGVGVLSIGDNITFDITATDDLTTGYAAANCTLDGTKLGLGAAVASNAYAGNFAYTATEATFSNYVETANYTIADWASAAAVAGNILVTTVTDDAGNTLKVPVVGGAFAIDLRRPKIERVRTFSYSFGADAALGGADDQLIDENGNTYKTLTLNDLSAGLEANITAALDDGTSTTMEIVAIYFDEDIASASINEESIGVNLVTAGSSTDISSGTATKDLAAIQKVANVAFAGDNNFFYTNTFVDPVTGANKNVLFIATLNAGANTNNHLAKGSRVEVLFNDVLGAGPLGGERVCDVNGNEIDYVHADYTGTGGMLAW